jgi:ubiquinone/menaquinone biosynthesis C-methylase UbiE
LLALHGTKDSDVSTEPVTEHISAESRLSNWPAGDRGRSAQVTRSAAAIYDQYLVPALFAPWAPVLIDAAGGLRDAGFAADIACGTGVLARAAARHLGLGRVIGLDRCDAMLSVARDLDPSIVWKRAPAECMPLWDESFDMVFCNFGLAAFKDQVAAIREMMRIVRPYGCLALTTWDAPAPGSGFQRESSLLRRFCGAAAAAEIGARYSFGDIDVIRALFRRAGIGPVSIETRVIDARFASSQHWLYATIKGGPLATLVNDIELSRLLAEADDELGLFAVGDGSITFSVSAHVVVAQKL